MDTEPLKNAIAAVEAMEGALAEQKKAIETLPDAIADAIAAGIAGADGGAGTPLSNLQKLAMSSEDHVRTLLDDFCPFRSEDGACRGCKYAKDKAKCDAVNDALSLMAETLLKPYAKGAMG